MNWAQEQRGKAREGSMYESAHAWYAQTLKISTEHTPVRIINISEQSDGLDEIK